MALVNYDRMAPAYDAGRDLAPAAVDAWRVAVEPFVRAAGELPILDVGSGTGQFAGLFARWFAHPVVGVEPSNGMRAQAEAAPGSPFIRYHAGDAAHIPLGDGSAGLAWLSTVIHHIPDLPAAAREIRRVLPPGAPVLIRSAFPDRLDRITLFRFFPEAREVAAAFPTVEATVEAFTTAGFAFESLTAVTQRTATTLEQVRARVAHRADTTLRRIPDSAFEAGLARLDAAIARGDPAPEADYLDLLVLRG
ncbi:MAG: class I SAM-dependent methyltransferase [Hyphomicrobiales bacterium]